MSESILMIRPKLLINMRGIIMEMRKLTEVTRLMWTMKTPPDYQMSLLENVEELQRGSTLMKQPLEFSVLSLLVSMRFGFSFSFIFNWSFSLHTLPLQCHKHAQISPKSTFCLNLLPLLSQLLSPTHCIPMEGKQIHAAFMSIPCSCAGLHILLALPFQRNHLLCHK